MLLVNIILINTGSFIEKGFQFNDIDILIIKDGKRDLRSLEKNIEKSIGIKPHLILLSNKTLLSGLSTDPLYSMMLSKYISYKRTIFKVKKNIDYKILDIQLLKSKSLIDNFDILSGKEKYYLSLNLISIYLFIHDKKLSKDVVNSNIESILDVNINNLKENMIDKKRFLNKYKKLYDHTFNKIMENI